MIIARLIALPFVWLFLSVQVLGFLLVWLLDGDYDHKANVSTINDYFDLFETAFRAEE